MHPSAPTNRSASPAEIGALLDPADTAFVLLEDRLDPAARARLYTDPVEIIRVEHLIEIPSALARIEAGLARGLHAAGYLGFEFGYGFEPRLAPLTPEPPPDQPLAWIGLFPPPRLLDPDHLDQDLAALGPPPPLTDLVPSLDRAAYGQRIGRLLDLIREGEVYQVNLTLALEFRYGGDPLALYAAMRARQPVAYGGVVAFDGWSLLSVSPELFFEVTPTLDGLVATTRPMKGTVARGGDAASDQAARDLLAQDSKQRAENLMIVDLLRNDLARVAIPGTVQVPALMTVETYPSLHTLTSTITARLAPGVGPADLMAALFPCGSITGAPKVRAMELIAALEPAPRGPYTGAIGVFDPDGHARFNVAIRTAVLDPAGRGRYGIGGGIVADSTASSEYDEALLKGRVITDLAQPYQLLETLGWSRTTGYGRLERHLDRLAASAARLGFRFDRAALVARLDDLALGFTEPVRRIRIALDRDGQIDITASQPAAPPAPSWRLVLSAEPVDAGDPFLAHKTSRRDRWDRALAAAQAAGGDEALMVNRAGWVTETSRHSIFLIAGDRLLTPPLAHGLLPGVLRQSLIEAGRAVERPLSPVDLVGQPLLIGNSLNGLMPAHLMSQDQARDPENRPGN